MECGLIFSKGIGIESFLKKSIEHYPDIKTITLCSVEGTELCSGIILIAFHVEIILQSVSFVVNRPLCDGNSSYNLVPSFIVSIDQVYSYHVMQLV